MYIQTLSEILKISKFYLVDGNPWNIDVLWVKCIGLISIHVHQSYSLGSSYTVKDSIPGLIVRIYLKTLEGKKKKRKRHHL